MRSIYFKCGNSLTKGTLRTSISTLSKDILKDKFTNNQNYNNNLHSIADGKRWQTMAREEYEGERREEPLNQS